MGRSQSAVDAPLRTLRGHGMVLPGAWVKAQGWGCGAVGKSWMVIVLLRQCKQKTTLKNGPQIKLTLGISP